MNERHLQEILERNRALPSLADADLPAGAAVQLAEDNARLREQLAVQLEQIHTRADDRDAALHERDLARDDNARLRTLVKAAEYGNHEETASGAGKFCPWCGASEDERHLTTCPAFTPEGEVR